MVLDLDGQALVFGIEARSLRHGPALEHSVELEAKVVVQAARRVALNGEPCGACLSRERRSGPPSGKIPLSPVLS
jgi:hypothetical protein